MRCEEATSRQAGKPCFSGLNFAIALPIGNMAPGLLWGKDVIFGVLADFGVKMVECGWVQMNDDECDEHVAILKCYSSIIVIRAITV